MVGMSEPESPGMEKALPRNGAGSSVSDGEQALHRSINELRQTVRELEQFAYVVSHDLQAPLRSILGFSQLLSRRHKDQLSGEALEFLGYIEHSAQQAQTLIQDLLRLSRVGREARHPQTRGLAETLRSAIGRLGDKVPTATSIEYADLPEVNTDHVLLAQLFEQLLDNAIKFRRPDVAPRIVVEARREGDHWLIGIADNGIGIPPDQLENIFIVFRRLHAADAYPGSGIGLTISRKIAALLGGRLSASSDASGSQFILQLPLEIDVKSAAI